MKNLETTKNHLKILIDLWTTRQIGNTTLTLEGAKNYTREFGFIGNTKGHAKDILEMSGNPNGLPLSLETAIKNSQGKAPMPVIIDHYVMAQLLECALHHLLNSVPSVEVQNTIEKESSRRISIVSAQYDAIIDKLTTLAEKYQTRCHRIERLSLDLVILNFWEFKERKRLKREILKVMAESMQDPLIGELFDDLKKLVNS